MFFFCFLFFWITLAVEVPDSTLKLLETEIKGTIVFPEDSNFQKSSKQWNAQFDDKAPRAIIFCEDRNDIQLTIRTLEVYATCTSIRSAGHSFPGWSVMNDCIVIDVSRINHMIFSNNIQKSVIVGAGTNFWDFTHYMAKFNRTTTHGFGPTVSFGGYTQGGGVGLTHRKLGLAIDNLIRAEIILYNGTALNASASENIDLFWALRGGGGGNFGVVSEYEFLTYDASDQVLYAMLEWRFTKSIVKETAEIWQQYIHDINCSRDFGLYWRINGNPVLGELGTKVQIYGIWTGELNEGKKTLDSFIALFPKKPKITITPMMIDKAFEKFMGPYRHTPHTGFYLQSKLLDTPLEGDSLDSLAEQLDGLHALNTFALIWMDPLGGKVSDIDPADTAFYWRKSFANFAIFVFYLTESGNEPAKNWMENTFDLISPPKEENQAAYVNFNFNNISNWQHVYYGKNYERLQKIKENYDPNNFWNYPQSIELPEKVQQGDSDDGYHQFLNENFIGGSGACIIKNCSTQGKNCFLDKLCRKTLICIGKCGTSQTCTYGCELDYANDVFDSMFTCMVDNSCIPHYPPDPFNRPTHLESGYNMETMSAKGQWWIVRGFSPAYDKFPCQFLTFTTNNSTIAQNETWTYTANFEYEENKYATLEASIVTNGNGVFLLEYTEHGLHHVETWYLIAATSDKEFGYESRVFRYQGTTPIMDYDGGIWFQYTKDYNSSITSTAFQYIETKLSTNDIDVNTWSYTDNSGCTNGPK